MALVMRGAGCWIVAGALLLVACNDDEAYDNALRDQRARAAAAAEAHRMAEEEALAEDRAQRARREQAALAIESDAPALLSEDQLHQVLDYYCGDCHFHVPCGSCERGGIYLDDVQQMLLQRTVIPGDAEGSRVIQQMRAHRGPLPEEFPPASEAAIALVADFINQLPLESDEDAEGR